MSGSKFRTKQPTKRMPAVPCRKQSIHLKSRPNQPRNLRVLEECNGLKRSVWIIPSVMRMTEKLVKNRMYRIGSCAISQPSRLIGPCLFSVSDMNIPHSMDSIRSCMSMLSSDSAVNAVCAYPPNRFRYLKLGEQAFWGFSPVHKSLSFPSISFMSRPSGLHHEERHLWYTCYGREFSLFSPLGIARNSISDVLLLMVELSRTKANRAAWSPIKFERCLHIQEQIDGSKLHQQLAFDGSATCRSTNNRLASIWRSRSSMSDSNSRCLQQEHRRHRSRDLKSGCTFCWWKLGNQFRRVKNGRIRISLSSSRPPYPVSRRNYECLFALCVECCCCTTLIISAPDKYAPISKSTRPSLSLQQSMVTDDLWFDCIADMRPPEDISSMKTTSPFFIWLALTHSLGRDLMWLKPTCNLRYSLCQRLLWLPHWCISSTSIEYILLYRNIEYSIYHLCESYVLSGLATVRENEEHEPKEKRKKLDNYPHLDDRKPCWLPWRWRYRERTKNH